MAKFLKIGSLKEGKNGNNYIEIDNFNFREFVAELNAHGAENLKGLDKDALKSREVPRLLLSIFEPKGNAPDFIKGDICIKIGE